MHHTTDIIHYTTVHAKGGEVVGGWGAVGGGGEYCIPTDGKICDECKMRELSLNSVFPIVRI